MTTDRKLRTRAVENASGAKGRGVEDIKSIVDISMNRGTYEYHSYI